jgi:hypothetical protein
MRDGCARRWHKVLKTIRKEPATTRSCWYHLLSTRPGLWIWILFDPLFELVDNHGLVAIIKESQSNRLTINDLPPDFVDCPSLSSYVSRPLLVSHKAQESASVLLDKYCDAFPMHHCSKKSAHTYIAIRTRTTRNQRRCNIIWCTTNEEDGTCLSFPTRHFLSLLPPPYPLHAILLPSQSFVVPHYQWQKAQTNRGRYQKQEAQAEQGKADKGRQTTKVSGPK